MGYSRTTAVALTGTDATIVTVETAIVATADPKVRISGLPETVAEQAQTRVRSALANSSLRFPDQEVTITCNPATPGLVGSATDLALAVTVLGAAGDIDTAALSGTVLLAELGLDGSLRALPGVYPALTAARAAGFDGAIVAADNAAEAALVEGMTVFTVPDLATLAAWLWGQAEITSVQPAPAAGPLPALPDLADLPISARARWALEVAAAGGHHMLLVGPPGAATTAIAERLPGLLPALTAEAAEEVTGLHSLRGRLIGSEANRIEHPPFAAPHHSITTASFIGGGAGARVLGEVALAHRGVLFIDEAPDWPLPVLDSLWQVLESGEVRIRRGDTRIAYPADVQLVLAAAPCPCRAASPGACRCRGSQRRGYLAQISRSVLNRVDLRVHLPALGPLTEGTDRPRGESSEMVAARVAAARAAAAVRWSAAGEPWRCNRDVPGPILRSPAWRLPDEAVAVAHQLIRTERITARGYDRALKLAWTIADLRGHEEPTRDDVAAAASLRLGLDLGSEEQ
ncbi:YifB family Mg chelatase-like AAA ATPase [Glycomyces sp. MUSA5-2]|uniref:YifB family Mg chelatase-like AAA ATPase n=1 Tax=Glycomyces sp. MUSA5-2 TaxID=2053002 RepID=UPI003007F474